MTPTNTELVQLNCFPKYLVKSYNGLTRQFEGVIGQCISHLYFQFIYTHKFKILDSACLRHLIDVDL